MATTVATVQFALEETPRYEGAVTTTPYRIATDVFYFPITQCRITPAPQLLARTDELRGIEGAVPSLIDTYAPAGDIAMRAYLNALPLLLSVCGYKGVVTAGDGANAVQTFTPGGTISGGTFTITFSAQTTAAIAWNATAAQIQTALEALSTIGVGNVLVGGGPMPALFTVTFRGALGAGVQPICTVASSLTGTAPTLTPSTTTPGVVATVTDPDLGLVSAGSYKWVFSKRVGIQAKTMQVLACYPNEGVFLKGQGYGLSALTLDAAGALTGTMEGLVIARTADPNLTPVVDTQSIWPIRRGDLTLTWLTGSGVSDDFSLAIANPVIRRQTLSLSPSSFFPDRMEQGDAKVNVTGQIMKSTLASADIDALLTAGTFAATARWKTSRYVANSASKYATWFSFPNCQITGGDPDEIKNVRRFGATFNWDAQWDEASGSDSTITVVCGTASIQAPGIGY